MFNVRVWTLKLASRAANLQQEEEEDTEVRKGKYHFLISRFIVYIAIYRGISLNRIVNLIQKESNNDFRFNMIAYEGATTTSRIWGWFLQFHLPILPLTRSQPGKQALPLFSWSLLLSAPLMLVLPVFPAFYHASLSLPTPSKTPCPQGVGFSD